MVDEWEFEDTADAEFIDTADVEFLDAADSVIAVRVQHHYHQLMVT